MPTKKKPLKRLQEPATKKAPAKALATRATKTNGAFDATRLKVLKALAKERMPRTELKKVAPYANYTGLMRKLEEEGVVKEVKGEDDAVRHVEITTKGRNVVKG